MNKFIGKKSEIFSYNFLQVKIYKQKKPLIFMVKKGIKKEDFKTEVKISEKNMEKILIENFVSLQRVMVNLSEKFDGLSNNISKLLELFELSASALAKKDINFTKPMDEEKIIGKLNNILEQNKIIARGMALMGEGTGGGMPLQERTNPAPVPAFRQPPAHGISPITKGESYQKSPFKGF